MLMFQLKLEFEFCVFWNDCNIVWSFTQASSGRCQVYYDMNTSFLSDNSISSNVCPYLYTHTHIHTPKTSISFLFELLISHTRVHTHTHTTTHYFLIKYVYTFTLTMSRKVLCRNSGRTVHRIASSIRHNVLALFLCLEFSFSFSFVFNCTDYAAYTETKTMYCTQNAVHALSLACALSLSFSLLVVVFFSSVFPFIWSSRRHSTILHYYHCCRFCRCRCSVAIVAKAWAICKQTHTYSTRSAAAAAEWKRERESVCEYERLRDLIMYVQSDNGLSTTTTTVCAREKLQYTIFYFCKIKFSQSLSVFAVGSAFYTLLWH